VGAEVSARLLGRRYLTVAEFAAATGVKEDTVRDRCERGVYRCRKRGTRWRIWASEVARTDLPVR
jgi:excisionase family DNA binding protein